MRPIEYTITTADRVAWGISPISGASRTRVATAAAAVTRPATWVRAPAERFTAVWECRPRRHGAEQAADDIAHPRGQQLPVRPGTRLTTVREGPRRGDGLGEAHERDAERTGPELLD
jgi:hypothetical protein